MQNKRVSNADRAPNFRELALWKGKQAIIIVWLVL